MFGSHTTSSTRKGTFDPTDKRRVKHRKLGVWDLYYEEKSTKQSSIPGASWLDQYTEIVGCLPFIWRMIKDVVAIPDCSILLGCFLFADLGKAVVPALTLWYQAQLLEIMQVAIDTRTVDKDRLVYICSARIACSVFSYLLELAESRTARALVWRTRNWSFAHVFRARARLDLPTYETSVVQQQLADVTPDSSQWPLVWETLHMTSTLIRAIGQAVLEIWVLGRALNGQHDGWILGGISVVAQTIDWVSALDVLSWRPQVWAITTTDKDYLKMKGLQRLVHDMTHRKELLAGNLSEYAVSEYERALHRLGDTDGPLNYWQNYGRLRKSFSFFALLQHPLRELPQIVFTLRAVQHPANMPVSLASLQMLRETTDTFAYNIYELMRSSQSFAKQLARIRRLYEVANVPNTVVDGTLPFPEDSTQIRSGIALEFRHVSFKYPGSANYALQDISFNVLPGQLCVIVGSNGSGKSTILKLITRLYDPQEGQIFIGGHDIRTLKLRDLRQAISVLFQDYTHFPLSIRDNIALGDPTTTGDDDHVRLAARLGGAEEFVDKLPEGFDTYLDRPVRDYYAGLPEGTTTLFGRKVDYNAVRDAGSMKSSGTSVLSGGQMQRLAVSRSFMRSVISDEMKVGLLLFDEPSASLDPVAEQDLFNRLRELRGSKTMLFSSHRFGNLTRHADLILYMDRASIVEAGTHDTLVKQGGGYANIWNIQAQAFL
ncbi:P-loop containing nucleoside triphosphate hydrolase protein [Trametes meyenii]|nr:P-loop containing nucleoside triphosphate hydrolase protein [Trametes meyenii]